jgi:hypothetical protein
MYSIPLDDQIGHISDAALCGVIDGSRPRLCINDLGAQFLAESRHQPTW